jgi:hypothetical protein
VGEQRTLWPVLVLFFAGIAIFGHRRRRAR